MQNMAYLFININHIRKFIFFYLSFCYIALYQNIVVSLLPFYRIGHTFFVHCFPTDNNACNMEQVKSAAIKSTEE